jgi:hypothetical protein
MRGSYGRKKKGYYENVYKGRQKDYCLDRLDRVHEGTGREI